MNQTKGKLLSEPLPDVSLLEGESLYISLLLVLNAKFKHECSNMLVNLIVNEIFKSGLLLSANKDKLMNYLFEYEQQVKLCDRLYLIPEDPYICHLLSTI